MRVWYGKNKEPCLVVLGQAVFATIGVAYAARILYGKGKK